MIQRRGGARFVEESPARVGRPNPLAVELLDGDPTTQAAKPGDERPWSLVKDLYR